MSEPTCRSCYALTLTPDELDRFNAEPVTSCVYLCPKHQAVIDALMSRVWAGIEGNLIRRGEVSP